MHLSPRARMSLWVFVVVAPFLLPGWSGRLVPTQHDAILRAARQRSTEVSLSVPGERPGERWHLTYMNDDAADFLQSLRMRKFAPSLLAPDFAAHIPAGSIRADGYYAVETRVHWPWWWPGGGLDLREPE